MDERRKQGLCYYYDDNYSLRHKCKETKLLQIDVTDNNSADEAPSLEVPEEEVGETQINNDLIATPDHPIIYYMPWLDILHLRLSKSKALLDIDQWWYLLIVETLITLSIRDLLKFFIVL